MNFFSPETSINSIDNCWLFIMQLACVLNMVAAWRKTTKVRVFMCSNSKTRETNALSQQWEQMLQMLRIEAKIHVVIWDHITSPLNQSFSSEDGLSGCSSQLNTDELPNESPKQFEPTSQYLNGVNTMIQEHSSNTSIIFMYLPPPPANFNENNLYHQRLDLLTRSLPPTLLVHGIHPVISTTI